MHYAPIGLEDLLRALYRDPGWRLAFSDDVAAVFVRRRTVKAEPDLDVDAPDLFPPLGQERGYGDFVRRMGRVRFYSAVGRPRRAQAELEAAAERHPHRLGRP